MNEERELNWDDEIERDNEYTLLPEGDYNFEVIKFERARHTPNPGGKLPACNKAVLTIRITGEAGESATTYTLFLHSKMESRLCEFFTAIGQRSHGQKYRMNWNEVVGSKGRCKVGIRTYTTNSGEEGKANEIKKFYEPSAPMRSPAPAYAQGKFF